MLYMKVCKYYNEGAQGTLAIHEGNRWSGYTFAIHEGMQVIGAQGTLSHTLECTCSGGG